MLVRDLETCPDALKRRASIGIPCLNLLKTTPSCCSPRYYCGYLRSVTLAQNRRFFPNFFFLIKEINIVNRRFPFLRNLKLLFALTEDSLTSFVFTYVSFFSIFFLLTFGCPGKHEAFSFFAHFYKIRLKKLIF